ERKRRRLSQAEVAEQMSTTQSAISEMEKLIVEPRLSTLQRYARILGLRLSIGLVAKPVGFYADRTLQRPIAARARPEASRSAPGVGAAALPTGARSVKLDNVTFVNFQKRQGSPLGGSIVARLEAQGVG